MNNKVIVVDYGITNLKNIVRGLQKVGADVEVCNRPERVEGASHIVVPGVGAFQTGMQELKSRRFDEALTRAVEKGLPILGICLGMQLFMEESFEHGHNFGLGFISGAVEQIPSGEDDGQKRKVPHIGWSKLILPSGRDDWAGSCLEAVGSDSYCYFVHSFMVQPRNRGEILAECLDHELPIVAAVKSNNITGLQFHPERSGPVGLGILAQFLKAR